MNKILLAASLLTIAAGASAQTAATMARTLTEWAESPKLTAATATLNPSLFLATDDGSLTAGITCLNAGGDTRETVWAENFDDGADGWTLENAEQFSWTLEKTSGSHDFSTIDPSDAQSLTIEGDFRYYNRGYATAVSPAISVPRNANLAGYIGYSYNLTDGYCTLTIYASDDDEASWATLWSSSDDSTVKSWAWHDIDIDMTAYAGKTVKLKFEYGNTDSYDNKGYMGDFAIDGLQLTAASEVTRIDVMTGDIVKFADASTGNPTSWLWNFPGGTPSTSTEQYPQVYYTADGTYDVSLTVSDGTTSSTATLPAFVSVTGVEPTAKIGLPATFRYSSTRNPMVAPLAAVQFSDASSGFPTSREWTFSGVDATAGAAYSTTEANPTVGFSYLHEQEVALTASNSHGSSADATTVSVEYEGYVTNLRPDDYVYTFDLDGYGEFPGTNSLGMTEFAERFSKPSRPMMVYGVTVYFTDNTAEELIDQITDIKVSLCKSENGLPGEELDFMSWRVFELETSGSTGTLSGTTFEFTSPIMVDDEFFIVVSGFPEKSESCTVSFATAQFRGEGNTAYFKQRGEWKSAESYFPAGQNHTSFAVFPYVAHSVMSPLSATELTVGPDAGEIGVELFSYFGYNTPVAVDSDWCRVVSEPNGMTVDTPKIGYDALPAGLDNRTAKLTFTDGMSSVEFTLTQEKQGGVATVKEQELRAYPSVVGATLYVELPEAATVEIVSAAGSTVYRSSGSHRLTVDATGFAPGLYIVKAATANGVATAKVIKR